MYVDVLANQALLKNRFHKVVGTFPTVKAAIEHYTTQPGVRGGTLYIKANGYIGVETFFAEKKLYGKVTVCLSKR